MNYSLSFSAVSLETCRQPAIPKAAIPKAAIIESSNTIAVI